VSHQNFDSREQELQGLLTRTAADIPANADLSGAILRRLADPRRRATSVFTHAGAPLRHVGATLSAALVVALIAAGLVLLHPSPATQHPGLPAGSRAVPVTPVATEGPQGAHVLNVFTYGGQPTAHCELTGLTKQSHFVVNDWVGVFADVRGFAKGENHTVYVHWFLDNLDFALPAVSNTQKSLNSDSTVCFFFKYPQPGTGTARLFLDTNPDSSHSADPQNPALGATIWFAVLMPSPATPGGTGTPGTGTGTGTPGTTTPGSGTPTGHALAPAPVAWADRRSA
jgi:hypothetical protein